MVLDDNKEISEAISNSYSELLKSLDLEIDNSKSIYDHQKQHFFRLGRYEIGKNLPQISGSIHWSEQLRKKLTKLSNSIIVLYPKIFESTNGKIVHLKLETFLKLLHE